MSARPPRTGVVVLNWNGRAHLGPCLDSLAASDHPDCFVVLVDNGSADGSVEWTRVHHPGVRIVALDENRRFAAGNNAGAARAIADGAEVVVLLNNDATVGPECVREIAACLAGGPRVGIAGPRIVYADRPERIWFGGGRFDPWLGRVWHRGLRRAVGAGVDPAGPTDWVTGCALGARSETWRELGGLDESFYIYAEDVDFCRRAAVRGWRIEYVPSALAAHAVSASVGGHDSPFKAYHRVRARRQLLARHGRGSLWPVTIVLEHLALMVVLVARGSGRAASAVWRGLLDDPASAPRWRVEDLSTPTQAQEAGR